MLEDTGRSIKPRFGEILLEYGIITKEQLTKALEWQEHVGGRVGSILREMGYLDDDSLLNFLSKQFNTSYVNLFEIKVPYTTLKLLPFEKVKHFHALPVRDTGSNIGLAMINPNDIHIIQEMEFALGKRIEPSVVPYYQMEKAIRFFEEQGYGKCDFDGTQLQDHTITIETQSPNVYSLLKLVVEHGATELHLAVGVPPSIRVEGEIKRLPLPNVTSEQMLEFIQEVLTQEQKEIFALEREIDFAFSIPHSGRFRVNIYRQRGSITLTARHVMENIPSIADLGLPEWMKDYAYKTHGLILITGPSGHGKTTTAASLIDFINTVRRCNIVTIEDPVEYLHKHKKSNVNQREVGVDTETFSTGLRRIFRQNPDVILIGDMRDAESFSTALSAVERGYLVITTMHSQNTTTVIEKIINLYPEHQKPLIRLQFADAFLLVFAQRLIPRKNGKGKILAWEKLTNSARVKGLIRDNKIFNVRSLMQVASSDAASIDHCLARLCIRGDILFEDGLRFADNASLYQDLVKSGSLSEVK
jgi:twitching motility protein PilT